MRAIVAREVNGTVSWVAIYTRELMEGIMDNKSLPNMDWEVEGESFKVMTARVIRFKTFSAKLSTYLMLLA